ncbi:hypothetical protein [Flammeovirga sp. OC4]|uniref:hypothetical protein n=1 Tax=Flammeovirga sp. OC4 TaxID=1382345 RepID=UPI0005C68863|nr:hypothetical protein [Flammeovirga sp. OC4]
MNKLPLISVFIIIIFSCSNKQKILNHFLEIKQLNTLLLTHQEQLLDTLSLELLSERVENSRNLIQNLSSNVNLTDIEYYQNIQTQKEIQGRGLVYYFGDKNSQRESYSILIFGEDKETLSVLQCYEQFRNCGKKEQINDNWLFVLIEPDCMD